MAASSADSNQFYGSVSPLSVRKQGSVDGVGKVNNKLSNMNNEAILQIMLDAETKRPKTNNNIQIDQATNEQSSIQKSNSLEILKAESALP